MVNKGKQAGVIYSPVLTFQKRVRLYNMASCHEITLDSNFHIHLICTKINKMDESNP